MRGMTGRVGCGSANVPDGANDLPAELLGRLDALEVEMGYAEEADHPVPGLVLH